ncbi:MAG: ABC transporter permease [Chitinophagaceae bacterium]
MKVLVYLVKRELAAFWQNKILVIVFLVMPTVLATILGFVYFQGRVERLPIMVVDEDHSPLSATFVEMLSDDHTLHVTTTGYSTTDLDHLMIEKKLVAIVVIPYRFEANVSVNRHPEVNCYLNMTNTLTGGAAGSAIGMAAATLNAGILLTTLERKDMPVSAAESRFEAFQHNLFQQYNTSSNYLYYLWPGLIFAILHQVLLLATAGSFSREFANNSFNAAGLFSYTRSPFKLILVKIIPFIGLAKVTFAAYFILSAFFKIPAPVHPDVLFTASLLMLTSASLLGTLCSITYPMPLHASQTLMSIASPAFSLSGFSWPADQMPVVLRAIADIIPLTPFLRILRLTWLQGANIEQVMPLVYHQLILVAVYFLLTYIVLRKKMKLALKPLPLVPAT